jgi:anti-sigma regulatory factor (Ser/Thr protein kinase)
MQKQPTTGGTEVDGFDIASAVWRCRLLAAMANIFEPQVIYNEIFPATKNQVALVRSVVREVIPGHPELDDVAQVADELAGNSVLHSGSSFFGLIIARTPAGGLRVAVIDEGREGWPCLREHDPDRESGRGMQLVDALVQRWAFVRQAGVGTIVWFDTR